MLIRHCKLSVFHHLSILKSLLCMTKCYLYLEQWIQTCTFWNTKPVQIICLAFFGLLRNKITKDCWFSTRCSWNFTICDLWVERHISVVRQYHFIDAPNIVTCNACLFWNIEEQKLGMITLPLTFSVSESISNF